MGFISWIFNKFSGVAELPLVDRFRNLPSDPNFSNPINPVQYWNDNTEQYQLSNNLAEFLMDIQDRSQTDPQSMRDMLRDYDQKKIATNVNDYIMQYASEIAGAHLDLVITENLNRKPAAVPGSSLKPPPSTILNPTATTTAPNGDNTIYIQSSGSSDLGNIHTSTP